MLARSFLSAKELRISEDLRGAMIKLLGVLERGELKYTNEPCAGFVPASAGRRLPDAINMRQAFHHRLADGRQCGCMYTWLACYLGQDIHPSRAMDDLFGFTWAGYGVPLRDLEVPQIACALSNFLTTGEANWREAVKA